MGVASKSMWGGRRCDELGVFGTSPFGEREKSHYFLNIFVLRDYSQLFIFSWDRPIHASGNGSTAS